MFLLGRRPVRRYFHKILVDFKSERGSVSLLIIGLFIVLLLTTMVLTDISAIYLAKRSLSLTTEAAVQRGMRNLDASQYYSGEYNLTEAVRTAIGRGGSDPGIPIDCNAGMRDASDVISGWKERGVAFTRANLESLSIEKIECDGFTIYIESSAVARIPIPIPFMNIDSVIIHTFAGAVGERAKTNNYYGLDIG